MKAVRLRFPTARSTVPHWLLGQSSTPACAVALLTLGIALIFAGLAGWQSWEARIELVAARGELQAVQMARAQRGKPAAVTKRLLSPLQNQAWNQVARQLNTPWTALLDTLEAATPEEIALVTIEPDGRNGSIRLQVEAKTLDGLLAYAGTLKAIERFEQVTLLKHETNDQDATKPLRLSLDIRLKSREQER